MSEPEVGSTLTHESFGAIANETRLDILRALWYRGELAFIDLFDEVPLDDTGQFSYHLKQLVDQFVVKVGDRYKLTNAGQEIVMTVLASVDGSNPLRTPTAIESPCHSCGEEVHAVVRGDWLRIDCSSCNKLYASYPIPRAGVHDRGAEDFLLAFEHHLRRMNSLVDRGICPNCLATMERTVIPDAEPEPGLPFVFFNCCEHCEMSVYTVPATRLLDHPAVVSFYHEQGIDLGSLPHWSLAWMFSGEPIEVVAESPLRYTVEVGVGDAVLVATLDAEGAVESVDITD